MVQQEEDQEDQEDREDRQDPEADVKLYSFARALSILSKL